MSSQNKRKGVAGERELADVLTAAGFPSVRNERNSGGGEDVSHTIAGWWIECKRTERLDLPGAIRQAEAGAGRNTKLLEAPLVPVVCHRSNRQKWQATLPLEDLLKLVHLLRLAEVQQ